MKKAGELEGPQGIPSLRWDDVVESLLYLLIFLKVVLGDHLESFPAKFFTKNLCCQVSCLPYLGRPRSNLRKDEEPLEKSILKIYLCGLEGDRVPSSLIFQENLSCEFALYFFAFFWVSSFLVKSLKIKQNSSQPSQINRKNQILTIETNQRMENHLNHRIL